MSTTQTRIEPRVLEPLLVDARGVATLLGLSRATVFALHSRGKLPRPLRPTARAPRWRVDELRDWLAAGCPERERWERERRDTRGR